MYVFYSHSDLISMFGRKDKKADRKRGREKTSSDKKGSGGELAAMFGLNMEIPGECVCK